MDWLEKALKQGIVWILLTIDIDTCATLSSAMWSRTGLLECQSHPFLPCFFAIQLVVTTSIQFLCSFYFLNLFGMFSDWLPSLFVLVRLLM